MHALVGGFCDAFSALAISQYLQPKHHATVLSVINKIIQKRDVRLYTVTRQAQYIYQYINI